MTSHHIRHLNAGGWSITRPFVEIDPDPTLFSGFASYSEMPPTALAKQYFCAARQYGA